MTLGNLDANGIGRYDNPHNTVGLSFAGLLNLALSSVSQALTTIRGDSGWITPNISAAWSAIAGEEPGYRRLNGVVYLRGRASRSSGSVALFTLPEGFRPAMQLVVLLEANGVARRVSLGSSGVVFDTLGAGAVSALSVGSFPPFIAAN
jgi:hypothetical protein